MFQSDFVIRATHMNFLRKKATKKKVTIKIIKQKTVCVDQIEYPIIKMIDTFIDAVAEYISVTYNEDLKTHVKNCKKLIRESNDKRMKDLQCSFNVWLFENREIRNISLDILLTSYILKMKICFKNSHKYLTHLSGDFKDELSVYTTMNNGKIDFHFLGNNTDNKITINISNSIKILPSSSEKNSFISRKEHVTSAGFIKFVDKRNQIEDKTHGDTLDQQKQGATILNTLSKPNKITIDIDGFATSLEMHESSAIQTAIDIELDAFAPANKIRTKNYYRVVDRVYDVRELQSLRIGKINTAIGTIVIYVVNEVPRSKFPCTMYEEKVINIIMSYLDVPLIGAVYNDHTSNVFKKRIEQGILDRLASSIKEIYANTFIFVEVYGCKAKFAAKGTNDPFHMIDHVINLAACKYAKVDIACQVDHGAGNATFMGKQFWQSLGILPNYMPFFCEEVGNLNIYTSTSKKSVLTHQHCDVQKINFYSQVEDAISGVKTKNFFTSMAYSHMQAEFYNYSHIRQADKKVSNERSNYSKLFKGIDIKKPLGYRLELRVSMPLVLDGVKYLIMLLETTTYNVVKNFELADVIRTNIDHIISKFRCGKIESIYNNIFLETMLTEWYLKGSRNNHLIPKDHAKMARQLAVRRTIPIIRVDRMLNYDCTTLECKIETLKKLIHANKKVSVYEKETYNNILASILPDISIAAASKLIYSQYCIELAIRFGSSSKMLVLNYQYIKALNILDIIDMELQPLNIVSYVETIFKYRLPNNQLSAVAAIANNIIELHSITQDNLLKGVVRIFSENAINLGYKLHGQNRPSDYLIRLSATTVSNSNINVDKIILDLQNEVFGSCKPSNPRWSSEEIIQLVNGMMRYWDKPDKYKCILNDLNYGFFLVRTVKNSISDRFRCLVKNKEVFQNTMKLAAVYEPTVHTTVSLNQKLEKFNIYLSQDAIEKYHLLVQHGLKTFKPPTLRNIENLLSTCCGVVNPQYYDAILCHITTLYPNYYNNLQYYDDKWDLEEMDWKTDINSTNVEALLLDKYRLNEVEFNYNSESCESEIFEILETPLSWLNESKPESEIVIKLQQFSERELGWITRITAKYGELHDVDLYKCRNILFNSKYRPNIQEWYVFVNNIKKHKLFTASVLS